MEFMVPFRATLLPLWALCSQHRGSVDYAAAPCEFDLELYYLQANDGDGKNFAFNGLEIMCAFDRKASQKMTAKKSALDQDVIQNALLQILKNNGWSSWRAVCPHIFVETVEPHRTIVLNSDALHSVQEWLQSSTDPPCCQGGSTPGEETMLLLPATLHSPLTADAAQQVTINFPPRRF